MGLRLVFSILKPVPRAFARAWVAEALSALPGDAPRTNPADSWQYRLGTTELRVVAGAETINITEQAWRFASSIAARHNLLHLELRAQEGAHWDFTLFRGTDVVADFSTDVGYFDQDEHAPRPWKEGDLTTFADAWGIPAPAVAPYLFDWRAHPQPRRITSADNCEEGDVGQIFDFMRVLGIEDPLSHPDQFTLAVPTWIGYYRK